MATLFGRAASSLIAAIAGEEQQPAAAVAEASVGLEFPLSSANEVYLMPLMALPWCPCGGKLLLCYTTTFNHTNHPTGFLMI
jgi:hypothetical protein